MNEFTISDFEILRTGVDGGHTYIRTDIIYQGNSRKLVVFFADKLEEQKIKPNTVITVRGNIFDEGIHQSLMLNDAFLM